MSVMNIVLQAHCHVIRCGKKITSLPKLLLCCIMYCSSIYDGGGSGGGSSSISYCY